LKLTLDLLSVAENTFTGIDTSPKLIERAAMERAAMVSLPIFGSLTVSN
jgi:hypothetical protein